ncbi:F-box/WD repeat-containing protein 12 [Carlito syrichta]|uniref:F-box/WD repeat-containing protein 12 n=1 Tax=Carlito syrichta TaxID=1868482 RepID=A0A3Q0E1G6_CARSF|nr:F-box/WD repeat-containing protein 12 [Carlito syrichta]
MEVQLPDLPMVKIFSFLDPFSLLQASQVNKYWNKIAENDHLWRMLCQDRWDLGSFSYQHLGTRTWKQFFFHKVKEERRMAQAQPDDFIYKEVSENLGMGTENMAYVSGSGFTMDEQKKSVVCTVSSKYLLHAWDVQEGIMTWSSPIQKFRIIKLATLPQMQLAITVDLNRTIKVWNCQDRDALAALTIPHACYSLETFLTKDGPFLMVGDDKGDIHTFTVPGLRDVSKVDAFRWPVELLLCSPDKEWVFACETCAKGILPKVFFLECLLRPSEDSTPLSISLPFKSCCRGCWAPRQKNRIILMSQSSSGKKTGFITFDLKTRKTRGQTVVQAIEIASFLLPANLPYPLCMGTSDGYLIVIDSGKYLLLFTIGGILLQRFEYHQEAICNLWVDSIHVLTTSFDGSLHVYMWEEGGHPPYLKSCCHLEKIHQTLTGSFADKGNMNGEVRILKLQTRQAPLKRLWTPPQPSPNSVLNGALIPSQKL